MIVAGETSGELYGALLAEALKKKVPHLRVIGIGGERMQAVGVELLSGIASAFGLTEALSSIKTLKETFRKASDAFRTFRPSVLVLIDYPDFNLRLAVEATEAEYSDPLLCESSGMGMETGQGEEDRKTCRQNGCHPAF